MRLVEYLDPADRLAEVLFGLIMVLTFTLGAGLTAQEGEEGVHELMIAAIGCNVAWGVIDGVLYVMSQMLHRGRRARLIAAVKAAPDRAKALAVVRREVEPVVVTVTSPELRERLYADVLQQVTSVQIERTRLERDDVLGALASFVLVFATSLPAAFPFFFLRDPMLALRVSNLLLIVMLFVVGWWWAGYSHGSRIGTGLTMMSIGVVLVLVAKALGG